MATVTATVADRSGGTAQASVDYTVGTPALKPNLGGCGIDNAEFNAFQAAAGPLASRRTFDGALPASFVASKMGPEATSGRVQVWSWKPNVTTFATDTAAQNAVVAFWNTFPWSTLTEVIITLYHEPEDNIASGTFTLAQWKAAINKLAAMVKAYGQSKLKTCFILMGPWTFDSTSPYSAYDFHTGLTMADIHYVGMDPYKFKPTEPDMRVMMAQPNYGRSNPPAGWKSPMDHALLFGKPLLLPEWACTETNFTQAQKAAYITDAYAWMKEWNAAHAAVPIVHAQYFNTDSFANSGSQPTATWALDSTTTMNAFKAIALDSRS